MHKIVKNPVIANLILAVLFVIQNYGLWDEFNSESQIPIIGSVHFDPFWIQFNQRMVFTSNNWVDLTGVYSVPNFPFWLFFITIAVNLYFIYKLSKIQNIH